MGREGSKAWDMALGLAVTETVSWGILYYAFGVLLPTMERELACSRPVLTGAFSVALLVCGLASVPVGRWIDRHGARGLMALGSAAGAALVLAWSRVTDVQSLYLVWAGLGLAQAAVLYEPAFTVIASWFPEPGARARALLLVTSCAGCASLIFSPLTAWLLEHLGWREALLVLAAVLGLVTVPIHGLVLRRAPSPPQEREAGVEIGDVLRSRAFWALALAFSASSLIVTALGVHLIPLLTEAGASTGSAAAAAGFVGAMQVPGRWVLGPLRSRLPERFGNALVFLLQGLALLVLLRQAGRGNLAVFVVLFGMANGMATLARASVVADWYGSERYGSIAGVLSMATMTARALAPFGAGALYAATGGYGAVLGVLGGLALLAAALALAAEALHERRRSGL